MAMPNAVPPAPTLPPPTLERFGLGGPAGGPSKILTAYGADAAHLRPGATVRFHDFRLEGRPLRLAMCGRVEEGDGWATARILPVLGVIVGDAGEVVAADGW